MSSSGGVIAYGFREGYRSERLAFHLFSAFGPAGPIAQSDDFGIDLLCHLAKREGPLLHVGQAYGVQVKSNVESVLYRGDSVGRWFDGLDFPLFIAFVDKDSGRTKVHSTYNMAHLLLQCRWHSPPAYPTEIELQPEPEGAGHSEPMRTVPRSVVRLGGPILDFGVKEIGDDAQREKLRTVLEWWVDMDRKNCRRRQLGLPCFFIPTQWQVNVHPREFLSWYRGYFSGSSHIEDSKELVADALTSWALFAKHFADSSNDPAQRMEFRSKLAAIRALLGEYGLAHRDEFTENLLRPQSDADT